MDRGGRCVRKIGGFHPRFGACGSWRLPADGCAAVMLWRMMRCRGASRSRSGAGRGSLWVSVAASIGSDFGFRAATQPVRPACGSRKQPLFSTFPPFPRPDGSPAALPLQGLHRYLRRGREIVLRRTRARLRPRPPTRPRRRWRGVPAGAGDFRFGIFVLAQIVP